HPGCLRIWVERAVAGARVSGREDYIYATVGDHSRRNIYGVILVVYRVCREAAIDDLDVVRRSFIKQIIESREYMREVYIAGAQPHQPCTWRHPGVLTA